MLLFIPMGSPPPSGRDDRMLEEYIASIARSDKDALSALYQETHGAVYGFALSVLKSAHDAEDVLQETYIRVFQAADRYQPQGKPLAWLFTIARNLALMRLRERGKTVATAPEDWQEQWADSDTVTPEDRVVLQSVLTLLADEERQIVMLHAVAGFKHREIAAVLGLPLPTVLSKYSRSIKKLQNAMKEVPHDEEKRA